MIPVLTPSRPSSLHEIYFRLHGSCNHRLHVDFCLHVASPTFGGAPCVQGTPMPLKNGPGCSTRGSQCTKMLAGDDSRQRSINSPSPFASCILFLTESWIVQYVIPRVLVYHFSDKIVHQVRFSLMYHLPMCCTLCYSLV